MSKEALIIFVRHPELGKVKTRLAKDIGDAAALELYKQLLAHTHHIASPLSCDKFVFYADKLIADDLWSSGDFIKKQQSGKDLGQRMHNAFEELFAAGYERVVIIGSDCPEITTELLIQSFRLLATNEAAIGPSHDGGYYLLGLTKLIPALFEHKPWSTADVYKQTIANLERLNIHCSILPVLRDVDTAEDLLWLRNA